MINVILGVSNADTGISVIEAKDEEFRSNGRRSSLSVDEVLEVPVAQRHNRTIASHNL